tara:strand:- start:4703 stop:4810 length:108 start_codon:yes stop_codon:yes gene_type:complete
VLNFCWGYDVVDPLNGSLEKIEIQRRETLEDGVTK